MIRENQNLFNLTLIVSDAIIMLVSLICAWFLRFHTSIFGIYSTNLGLEYYLAPLILFIPIYLLIYYFSNLYSSKRHEKNLSYEFQQLLVANIIGALMMVTFFFILALVDYSRYLIFFFIIFNFLLTLISRAVSRSLLRKLRSKGYNTKYILIVGAGELGIKFTHIIKRNPYLGYKIIGFLDDNIPTNTIVEGYKIIGQLTDLNTIIEHKQVDRVIIAIAMHHYREIQKLINDCEKNGVKAEIIPDYYRYLSAKPYVDMIENMPIINIRYVPLDNALNRFIKRLFDIIFSTCILIITSPLLLIVAIAIKLTSPGPIIFKQERIGWNRKPFTMYKFRSMKVQDPEEEKGAWTTPNDNRKTRIGTWIRKHSVDELPQFVNVLQGRMSVSGPRPERPEFVEQFKETIPKYMVKHHVKPGITGLAQAKGWRGDTSIKKRIECDIHYVENWKFLLDIKIIFLTVINILQHKNAY